MERQHDDTGAKNFVGHEVRAQPSPRQEPPQASLTRGINHLISGDGGPSGSFLDLSLPQPPPFLQMQHAPSPPQFQRQGIMESPFQGLMELGGNPRRGSLTFTHAATNASSDHPHGGGNIAIDEIEDAEGNDVRDEKEGAYGHGGGRGRGLKTRGRSTSSHHTLQERNRIAQREFRARRRIQNENERDRVMEIENENKVLKDRVGILENALANAAGLPVEFIRRSNLSNFHQGSSHHQDQFQAANIDQPIQGAHRHQLQGHGQGQGQGLIPLLIPNLLIVQGRQPSGPHQQLLQGYGHSRSQLQTNQVQSNALGLQMQAAQLSQPNLQGLQMQAAQISQPNLQSLQMQAAQISQPNLPLHAPLYQGNLPNNPAAFAHLLHLHPAQRVDGSPGQTSVLDLSSKHL